MFTSSRYETPLTIPGSSPSQIDVNRKLLEMETNVKTMESSWSTKFKKREQAQETKRASILALEQDTKARILSQNGHIHPLSDLFDLRSTYGPRRSSYLSVYSERTISPLS